MTIMDMKYVFRRAGCPALYKLLIFGGKTDSICYFRISYKQTNTNRAQDVKQKDIIFLPDHQRDRLSQCMHA